MKTEQNKRKNAGDYMRFAIQSALAGIRNKQGGPFGACIVDGKGNVVAVAHNTVWKDVDPTAHSEIKAIRKACRKLKTIDLSGCTIYSTTEPCPMCFSAIHWARIESIVYGTEISDSIKYGFNEIPLKNRQLKRRGRLPVKIKGGFLRRECLSLFREWRRLHGKPY